MKTILSVWLACIAVMTLVFLQNRDIFLMQDTLSLNLYLAHFDTPPLARWGYGLIFFLLGVVLAGLTLIPRQLRIRRQLRDLHTSFDACARMVSKLKAAEGTPQRSTSKRLKDFLRRGTSKKTPRTAAPAGIELLEE